jgi:surface antigen
VVGTKSQQHNGYGGLSLWRGAALILALCCGGCSLGSLDSMWGSSDKSETTASITPPSSAKQTGNMPPDTDLAFTRIAVSEVLSRAGNYASVPWENPNSGARGTVTPIAAAYNLDGQTCRDFLASYVQGSSQAWLQGEACKQPKGDWEVRSFKPWKRS